MTNLTLGILGEALIDMVYQENGSFKPLLGGSPFNFALACSRLNFDTHYLSPISKDNFGQEIKKILDKNNVKNHMRSRLPTSLALVSVNEIGEPKYTFYRDQVADRDFNVEELIAYFPKKVKIFHTAGLALCAEDSSKLEALMVYLKKRKVKISIYANVKPKSQKDAYRYYQAVIKLLSYADFIKFRYEDLKLLYNNSNTTEVIRGLLSKNAEMVSVTLAGKSTKLYTKHSEVVFEGYKTQNIVDTIGASTSYFAALIYALNQENLLDNLTQATEQQLLEAVKYGCAGELLNIEKQGSQPATHQEITAYLHKQG